MPKSNYLGYFSGGLGYPRFHPSSKVKLNQAWVQTLKTLNADGRAVLKPHWMWGGRATRELIQGETSRQRAAQPHGSILSHLDVVLTARAAVYRLTMCKAWRLIMVFHHKQTSIKFDLVLIRPPNHHGPGAQWHDKLKPKHTCHGISNGPAYKDMSWRRGEARCTSSASILRTKAHVCGVCFKFSQIKPHVLLLISQTKRINIWFPWLKGNCVCVCVYTNIISKRKYITEAGKMKWSILFMENKRKWVSPHHSHKGVSFITQNVTFLSGFMRIRCRH